MVKSGSMVTGCPDRPEHRMQISHRDATLRPNLSPKLHARQPKLVYSELFRASLVVVCHPDVDVGRGLYPHLDTTARFMVMHGKTYGPVTEQDQEVLTGLHKGFKMFDMSELSVSIPRPAEFVDRFAIVGPPEECIRRIREIIDLGVDRIVVNGPTVDAVDSETKLAADLMVKEVLPAFSG